MCHISHVYPTGASLYFTVVAGQRGNPIEQCRPPEGGIGCDRRRRRNHHPPPCGRCDHRPWMRDEIGDLGVQVLRASKRRWIGRDSQSGKLIP